MVALPVIPGIFEHSTAETDYPEYVRRVARAKGVPEDIALGVFNHESSLDVDSARRADFGNGGGIGQFTTDTAAQYGTSQQELRDNPRKAIEIGIQLLRDNAGMFGGDYQKGAAAYFIGPGNVQQAERVGGTDWLSAADQIAAQYGQGTVSAYLGAVGGGASPGASTGYAGRSSQLTRNYEAPDTPTRSPQGLQPVSSTPGYLYDTRGLQTNVESGDVPYDAGQSLQAGREDVPLGSSGTLRGRLLGVEPDSTLGTVGIRPHTEDTDSPFNLGLRALGPVKDVADASLEPLQTAKDLVHDVGNEGIPGTGLLGRTVANPVNLMPGVGLLNQGVNAVREIGNQVGGVSLPGAGDLLSEQVPTTPAGVITTVGPGNLLKGARKLGGLVRGADEAAGVLGIVPKNARQLNSALENSLTVAREASEAVLAKGGSAQEARAAAKEALVSLSRETNVAADAERLTQKAVDSYNFDPAKADERATLRGRAGELSERMKTPPGAAGIIDQGSTAYHAAPEGVDVLDAAKAAERSKGGIPGLYLAQDAQNPEVLMAMERGGGRVHEVQLQKGTKLFDPVVDAWPKGLEDVKKTLREEHLDLHGDTNPTFAEVMRKPNTDALTAEQGARLKDKLVAEGYKGFRTDYETVIWDNAAIAKQAPSALSREADALDAAAEPARRAPSIAEAALQGAQKLGNPSSILTGQGTEEGILGRGQGAKSATGQAALPGMQATPPASGVNPLKEIMGVIGGLRTGFASGDMPVMRQGGVLAWGNKKITLDAFKKGVGAYADEALADAADAAMKADPLYKQALDDGLHFHDFGANAVNRPANFSGLNDSTFSRLQQQLPWIKGSERATSVFINEQAFQVYKEWTQQMRKAGVTDAARYEAVTDVINHAIGFSGSETAKNWSKLNALFSAEYTFSRFNVLADPFIQLRNGNPEAAKLAGQNLLGLIGGNGSLMTLLALTGEGTGKWSVNLNPTSGDFGQLRIGNTRYDTMAGFGPLFKTVARISDAGMSNDLLTSDGRAKAIVEIAEDISKFFENKEAPAVKAFTEAAWHGKAPDPKELGLMYIPGLATGIVEAIIENNGLTNKAVNAVGAAIPGFGSVGVNTYSTSEDAADTTAQQLYDGRKYDDLTPLERLRVVDQLPEDAKRGGRTRMREDLDAQLKKAGYKEPEKAPANESTAQYKAREERNKPVHAANQLLFEANPDLDVQRWFFANPHGGSLNTKAAVDKALEMALPDREVKHERLDRVLNESPKMTEAWKTEGERVAKYLDDEYLGKKYGDADTKTLAGSKRQDAKEFAGKTFAQLDAAHQSKVLSYIREELRSDSPKTDAALAYFGYGPDSSNKRYVIHSAPASTELKRLRDTYGREAAKPGYEFYGAYP